MYAIRSYYDPLEKNVVRTRFIQSPAVLQLDGVGNDDGPGIDTAGERDDMEVGRTFQDVIRHGADDDPGLVLV